MPKMKPKKSAVKRFRQTCSGFKHKHAFKSHILTKMNQKRKRKLRFTSLITKYDIKRIKRALCLC